MAPSAQFQVDRPRRVIGLTGALALHLAVLLSFFPITCGDKPLPPAFDYEKSPQLLPKPEPVQVTLPQLPESDLPGINGNPDPRICEGQGKEYKGIGILHNIGSLTIQSAPAQYPAYKAGARVGDFIHELYRIPGTDYMVLHVKRGGQFLKWRVKMEQICFKD